MLYVLRNERKKDGKLVQYIDPNSSGTLVFANGESLHLKKSDFRIKALNRWRSSATGGYYPMGWQVYIPKYNIDLTLKPEMENQELVTHQSTKVAYWEGSTRVYGIYGHKKVSGVAYVEMTGYAHKFRQRI
jgi:predicted secreted hydrolase